MENYSFKGKNILLKQIMAALILYLVFIGGFSFLTFINYQHVIASHNFTSEQVNSSTLRLIYKFVQFAIYTAIFFGVSTYLGIHLSKKLRKPKT